MKVGIQLYSVRNRMKEDPVATIRAVAEKGYRYLEVANLQAKTDSGVGFGVSTDEIKKILDDTGAEVFSAHIQPFTPDMAKPIIQYHKTIGSKYLILPMDFYTDRDDVLRKAELMNELGRLCAYAGLGFMYHNHWYEFQIFQGKTVFDLIAENTDPQLVMFELDTYWMTRGGQDPLEMLKRFGTRVKLIHQKDFPAEYRDEIILIDPVNRDNIKVDLEYFQKVKNPKTFTEIGTGILPIQEIINIGNTLCKSEYIVLEQDHSQYDELESIRISMESFKKFQGIEW